MTDLDADPPDCLYCRILSGQSHAIWVLALIYFITWSLSMNGWIAFGIVVALVAICAGVFFWRVTFRG